MSRLLVAAAVVAVAGVVAAASRSGSDDDEPAVAEEPVLCDLVDDWRRLDRDLHGHTSPRVLDPASPTYADGMAAVRRDVLEPLLATYDRLDELLPAHAAELETLRAFDIGYVEAYEAQSPDTGPMAVFDALPVRPHVAAGALSTMQPTIESECEGIDFP